LESGLNHTIIMEEDSRYTHSTLNSPSTKAAIILFMRKLPVFILALILLLSLSCRAIGLAPLDEEDPAETPTPNQPTPSLTEPQLPPTGTATFTPTPFFTPTPEPEPSFTVRYHPDHALYAGDQVSLEVIAPSEIDVSGQSVTVSISEPVEEQLGPVEFRPFGIEQRMQATFFWAWDTDGLEPGSYTLNFSIEPDRYQWQESLVLNPASALPPPEPYAEWESVENECCSVHFISGTEAERDLEWLLERIDQVAQEASQAMGVELEEQISVTLLPRVLGHGGFAGDGISVSYLDRNYAGSSFEMVLHHEMVHILDARKGGELRPTLLVEGVAVYLSGGHFKPEPILSRAAALLELSGGEFTGDMGWYLTLESLADDFYPAQHEIGYLQAAALVKYMVNAWGWEAFEAFYRDIRSHPSGSHAIMIERALQKHFQVSFSQLEEMFLEELKRQKVTSEDIQDVRLTVEFYESVRRYQQHLDPSAYFMTAWLPDRNEMRERGIVADFVRRPAAPANIILEGMLVDAHQHLLAGRYQAAELALANLQVELDSQILETAQTYEETLWPVPIPLPE
jgi:hypothetical protein